MALRRLRTGWRYRPGSNRPDRKLCCDAWGRFRLPWATLRSQRTFARSHDSAMAEFEDDDRAHQVAYDTVKRTREKAGDTWGTKSSSGLASRGSIADVTLGRRLYR